MAVQTFCIIADHMAVNAFLLKTVAELLVLTQTEWIFRGFMEYLVVMAVPAAVAGQVCGRII